MEDYRILQMTTYVGRPFGVVQKQGKSLKDFYERLAAAELTMSPNERLLLYGLVRDWLSLPPLPDPNRRRWSLGAWKRVK